MDIDKDTMQQQKKGERRCKGKKGQENVQQIQRFRVRKQPKNDIIQKLNLGKDGAQEIDID